jgi:hypothetical protein
MVSRAPVERVAMGERGRAHLQDWNYETASREVLQQIEASPDERAASTWAS